MHPALLALVLFATCPPLVRSQTLDEVRKAVDDYFGDDGVAAASRAAIGGWGNAALPALRELAGKPGIGLLDRVMPIRPGGWQLVCAVGQIDTPEAVEFLVEILDSKTGVSPHEALMKLSMGSSRHHELLRNHLRFEQLVFKFARDTGPIAETNRGHAAGIIADMRWEDGEPLIELMLQDKNLSLRKKAAAALKELTGREVEVPLPPLAFPSRDESELLQYTGDASDDVRGHFTTWFDGSPALTGGEGRRLVSIGLDGDRLESLDLQPEVAPRDLLALPDTDPPSWILQADFGWRSPTSSSDIVIALDASRRELWRHVSTHDGTVGIARLYGPEGCLGVVVADDGEGGFHGFTPDGKSLFDVTGLTFSYGVASHPRLPDTWVHWFGNIGVRDNAGKLKQGGNIRSGPRSGIRLYVTEAVVFPDEDGQLGIVAGGSGDDSVPTIARYDSQLRVVWHATVPARIGGLALLDPPGGSKLIAAATDDGQILIFDPEGALRQRIDATGTGELRASGHHGIYSISAGPMPGRRYGLAVGLLWATRIYELK